MIEPQQHAGVDGEVVDALLRLLDERVAVDLPRQLLGTAADLLERLVDRNRPDRDGGVADDPFTRLVNVAAGREIHHRVGAPQRCPAELLDLLVDRRGDDGVADVGVDLHGEVAADDHRLKLRVIDVRRNDRAPARHFGPHEVGLEPFADADELHLRRDDAFARVMQLRDRTGAAKARLHAGRERRRHRTRRCARGGQCAPLLDDPAAIANPAGPQLRKAFGDLMPLRSAAVVDAQRRLASTQRDLAHRDAHALRPFDVDLAGVGKRGREVRGRERRLRLSCTHDRRVYYEGKCGCPAHCECPRSRACTSAARAAACSSNIRPRAGHRIGR